MFNEQQVQSQVSITTERKTYVSPELKEYGNMAELTQGTQGGVLDIATQAGLTVSVIASIL